jgi:predicted transcriptional regulator of viral defense system
MNVIPQLFTYDEVKKLYPNVKNFYAFACRASKKGQIKQIKKGLYALVDPSTGGIYSTRFQIASHLFNDSYFSYHEALEYYGLSTQVFVSRFTYLTHVYVRDIEFEDVTYSSKKDNCDLEILNQMNEKDVRVVSLERAIVDSINNPSYAGGLEEIESALDACGDLNLDKVIKMLEYYDKAFLYQKVGYLFEKHFGDKIPDSFYQLCLSRTGNKIQYFEAKVGFAKLVLKWKLMVPKERDVPDELF